ncbi:hypothetical protein EDB92DRAFT_2029478 [Lactarius akahatsu]|uniref:Uncharacterized protein n=1 Tax=Lactarius akahatsu TaxID=416441 RepID=A0AAD4LB26_9AGAM|nr:hypothetical protein EDB92DRAFT_2029478 [Lactarius akahatsu]
MFPLPELSNLDIIATGSWFSFPSTSTRRTRKATTKAAPGTTINSGNTLSPDECPSTKEPDAKVDEGLGPAVDSDNKKAAWRQGKAKRAPNGGGPSAQVKAVVPTRTLPSRPGRNVHPAEKPLQEKLHEVRMAKERLVQLNITEEHKEDDLRILHLQRLSTAIHKRRHMDVESDDERFDLREADDGSDPDDSSSESDEATKTKNKASSRNKRVKGAARQELLTRTEDIRGTEHTGETRKQQKSMHDIGRFTAQDLRCKKYANSGLRLKTLSLAPPNAALTPTLLQQPDDTDPFELGGLSNSDLEETCPAITEIQSLVFDKPPCVNELVKIRTKADVHPGEPQATRKPPCHKSKVVKAIVKKDSKCVTEVQSDTHPNITCQCLDDSHWTRIFLLTLSHALYISDHPFTDWTRESSALVETVQVAFELSFTNISYTLSTQDGIVKAAYDRMKTRWSKVASDVLTLVKTFFERAEFKDQPEKIKDYVHWALRSGGPAYSENPVPKSSKLRKDDPNYTKPNWFLHSPFILPVAETYLGFASRSVLRPSLGPKSPPKGLYVMILTAVEHAMRAHLTGRFNAPGDFNHQTSWNAMKDFDRILDQVSESRWARALDFVDCNKENLDESVLSAYRADFYLSSSPTKPGV